MRYQKKLTLLIGYFKKLEESGKDYIRDLTRKLVDIHTNGGMINNGKILKESSIKLLIVLLMIIIISCASTTPKDDVMGIGESSPLLSGTRWQYSEDDSGHFIYYVELNKDGNAIWYDLKNNVVSHLTAESIWNRQGNTVIFFYNAGYRRIEGRLETGENIRKIIGTGENKHRNVWQFTMIEN